MHNQSNDGASGSKTVSSRWGIGLIGVAALAVALYLPALKGVPIWDDEQLLSGNAYGTHDIVSAFTHPFGNYYRPLTATSFAIENSLVHGQPLLYHVTNLALHALTAVLIACLALLLTKSHKAGVLAGVFFAAQPMQVGAVAWIGGRTDALSALFLTAFLLSLVRYHQTTKPGWYSSALVCFFLAALSKEQAVAMFPAVPISVFVFGTKNWKDAGRFSAPFVAVLLVYAALWTLGAPPPHAAGGPVGETFTLALRTFTHYSLAFLTPNTPSLITFTLENYKSLAWILLGGLLVAGCLMLLVQAWKRNRTVGWMAICGLLVYVPISNCPRVPSLIVGPFRCAEAGIAVACLLGIATANALQNKRFVRLGLLGANLLLGVYVTWWGVNQWITPQGFFSTVVENDPHFIVGVQFDAHYLDGHGRFSQSAQLTGNTLAWLFGTQGWPDVLSNKGKNAITSEVTDRLRTNSGIPNIAAIGNFVGANAFSLAQAGRIGEAKLITKDALILAPNDAWLNFLYGRILIKTDRQEALRHWETALKANPDYAECEIALGHQRLLDRRYAEAEILDRGALKHLSDHGYVWLDIAYIRLGVKDKAGASAALEKAKNCSLPPKPADVQACLQAIAASG